MNNELVKSIVENVTFVLEFLGIVAVLSLAAVVAERVIAKKNGLSSKLLTTRKIAMIGMFSAVAGILMLFEIPMPFAPFFYKIDASELPVLLCGFAFDQLQACLQSLSRLL